MSGQNCRALNSKGFQVVESLVALVLVALGVMMASSPQMFMPRRLVQEQESLDLLYSLERSLLSAFERTENFQAPSLRMMLQDGSVFPQFDIADPDGVTFTVPSMPLSEGAIKPSVKYYDKDKKPCASATDPKCLAKLELSMVLIAGEIGNSNGYPDWLRGNAALIGRSRFPIYGVAYRITATNAGILKSMGRGVRGDKTISSVDHTLPLPVGSYIGNRQQSTCAQEDVMAGIDADTGNAICLKVSDTTCSPTSLAKQLKIDGNKIYVDCVEYKTITCPPNYLVQQFDPRKLDGDDTTHSKAGTCVFVGAPIRNYSKNDPDKVTLTCGQVYDVKNENCHLVNEHSSDCSAIILGLPVFAPPNRGKAVLKTIDTNKESCELERPANVCDAPFSGGSWDAEIGFAADCILKPTTPAVVDMYGE